MRTKLSRWLRLLAIDTSPLAASADFKRLWIGNIASFAGSQMTAVAAAVQVYEQTGSTFMVGLLGLAALIPMVLVGPFAGSVTDAVDRRLLCLWTSGGTAVAAVVLFAIAITNPGLIWPVFLIVAVQSVLFAFDGPTRRVFVPRLLETRHLTAANALYQLELNLGHVGGPLVAGLILSVAGLGWAYLVEALMLLVAIYAIFRLPPMLPHGETVAPGWQSVKQGLAFLKKNEPLHTSFLIDLNAMVLSWPRTLFPALAVGTYGVGPGFVGVLYAAPAIGALICGMTSSWISVIRRQGFITVCSVVVWGALIAAVGVVTNPWIAVALLAIAGSADMVSAVVRATMLQYEVPDAMLGRMTSIYLVVVSGGPRIGDVQIGALAGLLGPAGALVTGGLACVAATVGTAVWKPKFTWYEPPAESEWGGGEGASPTVEAIEGPIAAGH